MPPLLTGHKFTKTIMQDHILLDNTSKSSLDSMLYMETESYNSSTECSSSVDVIHVKDSNYFSSDLDCSSLMSLPSDTYYALEYLTSNDNSKCNVASIINRIVKENHLQVYRLSQTNNTNKRENECISKPSYTNNQTPVVIINDLNSCHDIYKMVDEIIANEELHVNSSLFVIVPASDENDSSASESVSSTICIRFSENYFRDNMCSRRNRNNFPPSGIKFMSKGKMKLKDEPMNFFNKSCLQPTLQAKNNEPLSCSNEPYHLQKLNGMKPIDEAVKCSQHHHHPTLHDTDKKWKNKQDTKNCQADFAKPKDCRAVVMDTTEDRPCSCLEKNGPNQTTEPPNTLSELVENVFSEIVSPLMQKKGVSQGKRTTGKNQDTMGMTGANPSSQNPFMSPNLTTRISRCDVPPCGGYQPNCPPPRAPVNQGLQCCNQDAPPNLPPCSCGPANVNHMKPRANVNNTMSTGCDSLPCRTNVFQQPTPAPNCEQCQPLAPILHVNKGIADMPCLSCGRPNQRDGKKITCTCSGKEKRVQLPDECPCGQHQPPEVHDMPAKTPKSCACESKRGRKKNVICECPQEEEPYEEEEDYSYYIPTYVDPRVARKMQSDQTQTTSGFNFKFKKSQVEEELSFEDALDYYKQFLAADSYTTFGVGEGCECDENGRPRVKEVECECPLERYDDSSMWYQPPLIPAPQPEEPELKGLKISIGGKGSSSKGLAGICCFDLITE